MQKNYKRPSVPAAINGLHVYCWTVETALHVLHELWQWFSILESEPSKRVSGWLIRRKRRRKHISTPQNYVWYGTFTLDLKKQGLTNQSLLFTQHGQILIIVHKNNVNVNIYNSTTTWEIVLFLYSETGDFLSNKPNQKANQKGWDPLSYGVRDKPYIDIAFILTTDIKHNLLKFFN